LPTIRRAKFERILETLGKVTYKAVADDLGYTYTDALTLI